jgi:hypothetical protein
MKTILVSAGIAFIFLAQFSCKGVKNVSGTLTKSGTSRRDYSKSGHSDYTKIPTTNTASKDSVSPVTQTAVVQTSPAKNTSAPQTLRAAQPAEDGVYKRDYSRTLNSTTESVPNFSGGQNGSNADLNEKIVKQYAEMDRLADLVLYELGITERRWNLLIGKFKTAPPGEREAISADLDRLSNDQLKLYKAHVKIYKEGKTDWINVKKDVEATLLAVRGVGN